MGEASLAPCRVGGGGALAAELTVGESGADVWGLAGRTSRLEKLFALTFRVRRLGKGGEEHDSKIEDKDGKVLRAHRAGCTVR